MQLFRVCELIKGVNKSLKNAFNGRLVSTARREISTIFFCSKSTRYRYPWQPRDAPTQKMPSWLVPRCARNVLSGSDANKQLIYTRLFLITYTIFITLLHFPMYPCNGSSRSYFLRTHLRSLFSLLVRASEDWFEGKRRSDKHSRLNIPHCRSNIEVNSRRILASFLLKLWQTTCLGFWPAESVFNLLEVAKPWQGFSSRSTVVVVCLLYIFGANTRKGGVHKQGNETQYFPSR